MARNANELRFTRVRKLPVSAIDTGLVVRALQSIWTNKPVTASRLRGRIESVLDWARVSGYRLGENPARWRGHLDHLLPAQQKIRAVEHHAALPYAEIGAFVAQLREQADIKARALEFTILTASRTGEVLKATWTEIDFASKTWTVPAARMKSGREHRVPLTDAAIAVLKFAASIRHSDYIFPGRSDAKPLGTSGLQNALLALNRRDVTAHGFRSTFRDWAAERTSFPPELAELSLAHSVGSDVERAYRRTDLFDKRRRLMEEWAEFCSRRASGAVVPSGACRDPPNSRCRGRTTEEAKGMEERALCVCGPPRGCQGIKECCSRRSAAPSLGGRLGRAMGGA